MPTEKHRVVAYLSERELLTVLRLTKRWRCSASAAVARAVVQAELAGEADEPGAGASSPAKNRLRLLKNGS